MTAIRSYLVPRIHIPQLKSISLWVLFTVCLCVVLTLGRHTPQSGILSSHWRWCLLCFRWQHLQQVPKDLLLASTMTKILCLLALFQHYISKLVCQSCKGSRWFPSGYRMSGASWSQRTCVLLCLKATHSHFLLVKTLYKVYVEIFPHSFFFSPRLSPSHVISHTTLYRQIFSFDCFPSKFKAAFIPKPSS